MDLPLSFVAWLLPKHVANSFALAENAALKAGEGATESVNPAEWCSGVPEITATYKNNCWKLVVVTGNQIAVQVNLSDSLEILGDLANFSIGLPPIFLGPDSITHQLVDFPRHLGDG